MKIKWTPTIVVGWLTAIGAVVVGVAPILPPSAPEWLHTWLPFAGLFIALLTQSIRKLEPTPAEAVAVILDKPAESSAALDGRETLPPAEPK